jgi:hypothetical protein
MTASLPERIAYIELGDDAEAVTVFPGFDNTLVVSPPNHLIEVIEAEDTLFRTNSAVFLPDRIPSDEIAEETGESTETIDDQTHVNGLAVFKGVLRFNHIRALRGESKKLLITGHTDTAGSNDYNEVLSQKRARSVVCMMMGGNYPAEGASPNESDDEDQKSLNSKDDKYAKTNPDEPDYRKEFVDIVSASNTVKDQQQILKWISEKLSAYMTEAEKAEISSLPKWTDVDPGAIDGKIGENTKKAIWSFKVRFAKRFPPAGPYQDVRFSFDLDALKKSLNTVREFDKNTWAAVFEVMQAELQLAMMKDGLNIHELRKELQWVDDKKKAVGCGETWPIDKRGKDNYRSQSNRRVEILLYDPDEIKGVLPCKDGVCAKSDCHIFKDMDRYAAEKKELEPTLHWAYLNLDEDGNVIPEFLFSI